jgi:hypothetical protein
MKLKFGQLHDNPKNCYVIKINIASLEIFILYYYWGCFMYQHTDEVPCQIALIIRLCVGGRFISSDPNLKSLNLGLLQFYQYDARYLHQVTKVCGIRFCITINKSNKI